MNLLDIKSELDALKNEENSLYVLIDAAQFPRIWKILDSKYRHLPWLSLFERTGNDDAIKVGPVLIRIERDYESTLQTLTEQTKGVYCISWIVSQLSHSELRDHFYSLTNIETEDGSSWVMRYFDTRILPVWYQVLDSEQKEHTTSPLVSWGYFDRFGNQQSIPGSKKNDMPSPMVFVLTQKQENTLFDASYPDAIIQQIEASGSEELRAIAPAQRYPFISKQINTAQTQFNIQAVPDIVLFCNLALIDGDGFENRDPYIGMLSQVGKGEASLGDAFKRSLKQ